MESSCIIRATAYSEAYSCAAAPKKAAISMYQTKNLTEKLKTGGSKWPAPPLSPHF